MKLKIIDKCCNEFKEIEIFESEIKKIIASNGMFEIAPAKKDHSIIVHSEMTIEYVSNVITKGEKKWVK